MSGSALTESAGKGVSKLDFVQRGLGHYMKQSQLLFYVIKFRQGVYSTLTFSDMLTSHRTRL